MEFNLWDSSPQLGKTYLRGCYKPCKFIQAEPIPRYQWKPWDRKTQGGQMWLLEESYWCAWGLDTQLQLKSEVTKGCNTGSKVLCYNHWTPNIILCVCLSHSHVLANKICIKDTMSFGIRLPFEASPYRWVDVRHWWRFSGAMKFALPSFLIMCVYIDADYSYTARESTPTTTCFLQNYHTFYALL